MDRVRLYVWYKVDLIFDWKGKRYDLRIDDVTYTQGAPFTANSFESLGLYSLPRGEVWFDEIFAGKVVQPFLGTCTLDKAEIRLFQPRVL
jgi:hypothetical protein